MEFENTAPILSNADRRKVDKVIVHILSRSKIHTAKVTIGNKVSEVEICKMILECAVRRQQTRKERSVSPGKVTTSE